ncbi:dephospho-CoA kinase [Acetobacter nitrogenifigens DSM 23921 = NBRC 105050]|uniref:Dephospho-CoA kinase n=1 Tax=Acetobacter nitrogenifigens DSM 23921 = NBRC 105050 TaxID=1120919 RepID=A0A511XAE0_9PROT|nr:dephospho-CoA kinase [Acetobacter nitrogenifigens]GBQ97519.1 dephospho-CoA kinase [Acetobacter nitrogenifigens DSM 23921 = NBRC 105050]GEN59882.1 dephospho-CoA kinase [Acetobacter nitrogenifigens DSM 23921 = NBRC 105050]
MKIIGLTGGMGMGKTTVAGMFRRAGFPVFDSDQEVHRLQGPGGRAVGAIARLVPDALRPGAPGGKGDSIDRSALRRAVIGDGSLIAKLEAILHPMVFASRKKFLAACRRARFPWVVVDVPLLFETGADRACDVTVVVSAPRTTQIRRIARRRGMSLADAERLIARQMPDREKRRRADRVIRSGLSKTDTALQVRRLVRELRG